MQHDDVARRLGLLGRRLRALRLERGLSLLDVERLSDGALKGVVVGSYERGDRNVTVTRLSDIASFYGVQVGDLLSGIGGEQSPASHVEAAMTGAGIDARVTDWHHPPSATRGVSIRLTDLDAQRLADLLGRADLAAITALAASSGRPPGA